MKSQHGTEIVLDTAYPKLADTPLIINGKSRSDNPDRYKQHGFHFNADNCIACHACESACSEKNDLPPHLAFRRVGAIEGGIYPDVTRINISMACNHCEDPVCLKGCPTRAYTKYLEYGAVLQDPDICFGCGYCTWVCPYNAPQLDPVKGQVEKCNMCVDRLEVGLQPACVSACLGNALDFGVVEEIPKGQAAAKLTIPSFTDPAISRPNIRFQQNRDLPGSFERMDAIPLTYQQNVSKDEHFKVKEKTKQEAVGYRFDKLRSREDPLILFTLVSQFAVGAFLLLFFLPRLFVFASEANLLLPQVHPMAFSGMLIALVIMQTLGLVSSTLHLGKPQYFYRAFNNLRHSWVSREIAAMAAFFNFLGAYTLVTVFPILIDWLPESVSHPLPILLGWGAGLAGPIGIYCMYRCYRIPARPFWDHWHTGGVFSASGLILGSGTIGLVFGTTALLAGAPIAPLFSLLAWPLAVGLLLQGVSLFFHRRDLKRRGEEAAVSRMLMLNEHGKIDRLRLILLGILVVAALSFIQQPVEGGFGLAVWGTVLLLALFNEIISRALFYVLVVPTTVPRAFFWGNHCFEDDAQKTGLASLPQVGVVNEGH
ncbi:MAG: DmsC/YnfH family molybdoenzyme membrane anchor subunit [Nitrospiria bacterium]